MSPKTKPRGFRYIGVRNYPAKVPLPRLVYFAGLQIVLLEYPFEKHDPKVDKIAGEEHDAERRREDSRGLRKRTGRAYVNAEGL